VLLCGLVFHGAWMTIAIATYLLRRVSPLAAALNQAAAPVLDLARGRLAEASCLKRRFHPGLAARYG